MAGAIAAATLVFAFVVHYALVEQVFLEPTFFAVFYWRNSLSFALGLLGIFLLVFHRMLRAYRPITPERTGARAVRALLLGLGLGLFIAAMFAMRVNRPVPPAWFDPASVSTKPDSTKKTHLGKAPVRDEPVHSHAGDEILKGNAKGKPDGGALTELDRLARLHAREAGKPILYYFRADWCPNCPEFERYVLGSPIFAPTLRDFVVVKMDVTDFEKLRVYVDRYYGVHGTPAVVFRDREGRIVSGATVNGAHVSYRLFGKLLTGVAATGRGERVGGRDTDNVPLPSNP